MKWNANLYDDKHAFVFQYGESVLELLDVKPGERILDLGCGTGHLAKKIQEHGAEIIGIDASPEMIAQAKANYPELDFRVANGASFSFDEPFDAIFTNATLHWIHDADGVIKSVYNALKPGGRFVGEFGGKGNNRLMMAATETVLKKHGYVKGDFIHPWYYPSTAEYATRLEAGGFRVTFATHFDRQTLLQDGREGMAKWFSMFGSSIFKMVPADELLQILNEITDLLQPTNEVDGQWYADYKRLRFIAVKE
ncbi:class I SAM-dependent methyltransferase [Mucilaginibacter ginsenosidivorans]|uniref:Class I SAM-dependent methyltransferase n=1 Tax=Mucilaginibacter ginsenosidivorans TaxID=398053 RepID=A0A5B8UVF5_9SPHI|nr:class I SAM-dependent methyltransferase [Mucilaginibacter ginsenosidivorans]QEC63044.1 class I SAM-dependent methyltransferase [Mucilaginibacter ginsenosidivorans]